MSEAIRVEVGGCRSGGTTAAAGKPELLRIGFDSGIDAVRPAFRHAALVLVDIPIGLPVDGPGTAVRRPDGF